MMEGLATHPREEFTSEQMNSPMWTAFPSGLIAGVAVVFNMISLSFFIRKDHESLGKRFGDRNCLFKFAHRPGKNMDTFDYSALSSNYSIKKLIYKGLIENIKSRFQE